MKEHDKSFRDRMALGLTPLLLRLALAATFVWAGYGDLFRNRKFSPQDAAVLAELGVITPRTGGVVDPEGLDESDPAMSEDEDNQVSAWGDDFELVLVQDDPVEDEIESAADVADEVDEADEPASVVARNFSAADFPNGAEALGKHRIAIRIYNSVFPESGNARLPASFASGHWPTTLGTTAGVVEFIGGLFLLLGLLTRLSALLLAGTQAAALWMTYIAPNAIGSASDSFMWVLPHLDYVDSVSRGTWETMMWRFMLLMACFALFVSRPGYGMDSKLIFKSRPKEMSPETDE